MPVRHLLVWLVAGAACWSLLATAALIAPQTLLALGALVALPWLRRPQAAALAGPGEPVSLGAATAELPGDAGRERPRVLVAQSA